MTLPALPTPKAERDAGVELCRVYCCVAVVASHWFYGFFNEPNTLALAFAKGAAAPVFFLIAGFYLSVETPFKEQIRRFFVRVFIPMLVLMPALSILTPWAWRERTLAETLDEPVVEWGVLWEILVTNNVNVIEGTHAYNILVPLWFVFAMLHCQLCLPVVKLICADNPAAKAAKRYTLVLGAVVFVGFTTVTIASALPSLRGAVESPPAASMEVGRAETGGKTETEEKAETGEGDGLPESAEGKTREPDILPESAKEAETGETDGLPESIEEPLPAPAPDAFVITRTLPGIQERPFFWLWVMLAAQHFSLFLKNPEARKKYRHWLVFGGIGLYALSSVALTWLTWRFIDPETGLPYPDQRFFNRQFLPYFIGNVGVFLFFLGLPPMSRIVRKIVYFLADKTFYVYVVHSVPVIWFACRVRVYRDSALGEMLWIDRNSVADNLYGLILIVAAAFAAACLLKGLERGVHQLLGRLRRRASGRGRAGGAK